MRLSYTVLNNAFSQAWPPEKYGRRKAKSKAVATKKVRDIGKKLGHSYVLSDIVGKLGFGIKVNFYSERNRETRSFILDQNLDVVESLDPMDAGPNAKWGSGSGRDPEIFGDPLDPIEAGSLED